MCKSAKTSLLRVQDEITGMAGKTHTNEFFKKCNTKDFKLLTYPKRTNSKTEKRQIYFAIQNKNITPKLL